MKSTTPTINFPAANSPQRASSGTIRAKVPLKQGRSLMDWIRLGNSGVDLTGIGGALRPVNVEELAQHDTENDAWISVRGKVYNITPYLEYHPGSIPEIMKGAGKDATDLFEGIHKWVNAESMLQKCFIGPLTGLSGHRRGRTSRTGSSCSVSKSATSLSVPNTQVDGFVIPSAPVDGFVIPSAPGEDLNLPRYDWYQNDKIVTISMYTKKQDIRVEDVILELKNEKDFDAMIVMGDKSYEIHLDLEDSISHQQVRVTGESGKVDLLLTKGNSGRQWTALGQPLTGHSSLRAHKERDPRFWDCTLVSKEQVSHNTKLLCFEVPPGLHMRVPIGCHVHMMREVEGMQIGRNYTVVLPSLAVNPSEREFEGRRFHLMIKIYPGGTLTPSLESLAIGDKVTIGEYSGDFKESRLSDAKDIILIAGGTGFTPMIRIIRRAIVDQEKSNASVKLLFANREVKDILWREQLDALAETSNQRFQVFNTVSKPSPEWEWYEGRVSVEMLLEVLPPPPRKGCEHELLICVCGPDPFTHNVASMLKDLNYTTEMIHKFLG